MHCTKHKILIYKTETENVRRSDTLNTGLQVMRNRVLYWYHHRKKVVARLVTSTWQVSPCCNRVVVVRRQTPRCWKKTSSDWRQNNCKLVSEKKNTYATQCAAVKTHLSLMSDPPHSEVPFNNITLSMTCHGQAPRAAHWPLMIYGPTFRMFGDRWPHTALHIQCCVDELT